MESENKELRQLRTLDFFMGLFFALVGGYMFAASFGMFRDPSLKAVPLPANPGMTSLAIGGLLVLMGGALAVIGLLGARNPLKQSATGLGEIWRSRSFQKTLVIMGLIAVYFFVLWSNTPYWFSTMAFLLAMMGYFKAGAWWKILVISGLTTMIIIYFFGHLAMVLLPDEPGWLAPLYRAPVVGQACRGLEWFFTKLIPLITG